MASFNFANSNSQPAQFTGGFSSRALSSNNNNQQQPATGSNNNPNPFATQTTGVTYGSAPANNNSNNGRAAATGTLFGTNMNWQQIQAILDANDQRTQQFLAASQQRLERLRADNRAELARLRAASQANLATSQANLAASQANLAASQARTVQIQAQLAALASSANLPSGFASGNASAPRHGQDTFHAPTSAGTKYKSVTKPFNGMSNKEALDEQDVRRVSAKRPAKLELYGTDVTPYRATQVDDENSKLISICAMEVYADKSPEELRMEDYSKRPGGFGETNPKSSDKNFATNLFPPSDPIDKDDDPMDYESQKDDLENALGKANSLLQLLLTELSRSDWSDLNSVVFLRHAVLLDHLVPIFLLREKWKGEGKRPQFSVGYHYTTPGSLQEIWDHGVLTKADRTNAGVQENFSGSVLGDGIYTGNLPTDFYRFRRDATVGLMVLRIFYDVGNYSTRESKSHDTIVMRRSTSHIKNGEQVDYVNLRNSRQCAILMSFDGGSAPEDRLLELQTCVEECIDRVVAETEKAVVAASPPKRSLLNKILECQTEFYRNNECREFTFEYSSPQTLCTSGASQFFVPVSDTDLEMGQECPICLDTLSGDAIFKIKGCKHVFHEDCMEMVKRKFSHCPVCRFFFKEPRGHMPDGRMKVSFDPRLVCAGNSFGTIKIDYTIFFGIQKSYHENRGVMFSGTSRPAYIPDTKEGRRLLRRLMYAFLRGLTFRVGTSLTSGRPNSVTWAIHHKTITGQGPHGYPDTSYFDNCNDDLNAYGVPSIDSKALNMPELAEIDRYLEWRDRFTSP